MQEIQLPDRNFKCRARSRGTMNGVVEVVLGSLRAPTEAEQRELRAMWWRQARLGHTLPPEPGLIVIDGGGS